MSSGDPSLVVIISPRIRKMSSRISNIDTGSVVAQDNKDRGRCSAASASSDKWARGSKHKNKITKIGSYNVRTLNDTINPLIKNKIQRLIDECEIHNIDILTIQEHRQKTPSGENTKEVKHGDWTFVHTNSNQQSHGVAILYSKKVQASVAASTFVSDRILALHLDGNPKICIISAYAPTETANKDDKDKFYNDLNDFVLSIPLHTITITAGDFNARIGADFHSISPKIVGKHAVHKTTNDNGQRLIDFCQLTKQRPTHSHFPNRLSRLLTYRDPQEKNFYQLDHIMISAKWWNSIQNCRSYTTMDIGSDHNVLVANFKIKFRKSKRVPNERCAFNTEKLQNQETAFKFNIELKNRFNALLDTCDDDPTSLKIQKQYDAFTQATKEACENILGKKKIPKHPSWVSKATLDLIEKQNIAKNKYKQSRKELDKKKWRKLQEEVSYSYERDNQSELNRQLEELEDANRRLEHQKTWKIINKISGKSESDSNRAKVKRLDGTTPQSKDEIVRDWGTYFQKLLNNQSNVAQTAPKPEPSPDLKTIFTGDITFDEVVEAIKQLKRNKSPGSDYAITAEVLKDGGDFIARQLHNIIQAVYSNNSVPSQWTTSLIVPIPKKGNLQLMTNYRGISLTSIAAKTFNRVILNRIQSPIDKILRKNQAGFRPGRSCIQQINILRRIIDGAYLQDIPLYLVFIDFKKAFDSIDREMMFAILRHYGIPEKIVQAIRLLYENSTSRVFTEGEMSKEFKITTGVLQGDVLAPFLFIIVIDYVNKQAEGDFGYITHLAPTKNFRSTRSQAKYIHGDQMARKVSDLDFADDIALLENNLMRAQQQLNSYGSKAEFVGLEINIEKTMVVIQNNLNAAADQIIYKGKQLSKVDDFKYLGSYIGSTTKDLDNRIALTWVAFDKLRSILTSPKLHIDFRIRLLNASCISILLYGCESWTLTSQLSNKIDVFVRKLYRIMLGIRQAETHMSNKQLYHLTVQQPISREIQNRQLKFIGHCLRMNPDEPAKIYALYSSKIKPSNRRGSPPFSYKNQISIHLTSDKGTKLDVEEITKLANNRDYWNSLFVVPKKPAR